MDISMDIINQRVENINKLAKLNNSKTENSSAMDMSIDNIHNTVPHVKENPVNASIQMNETAIPRRRKLFDPNSISGFMSDSDMIAPSPNPKSITKPNRRATLVEPLAQQNAKKVRDKTIGAIIENETLAKNTKSPAKTKRARDDDQPVKPSAKKVRKDTKDDLPVPQTAAQTVVKKSYNTRRSSMYFQPVNKSKTIDAVVKRPPAERVMVFTNMHQAQIDAIRGVS